MFFVRILLLLSVVLCASGSEESHHRHRHSKNHQEFDLDRLMNRLDSRSPATTRATMTTKADRFDEPDPDTSSSDAEPGNSLWEETSTMSPLDPRLWDTILKNKLGKSKAQEDLEDEQDELTGSEEDEEGFVNQHEQADSYSRAWMPRSSEPSLTSWKMDHLGSRKAVESTFAKYNNGLFKPGYNSRENMMIKNEILEHHKRVTKETICHIPKPKVIRVLDVYPSTTKLYSPQCTVLHQCGDDTGCCGKASSRCGPKASATKRVELYFSTTYIFQTVKGKPHTGVEKLPFYNHTECECQEVAPRDSQISEYRVENQNHIQDQSNRCKCPTEFTVRWLANGSCTCDCFDKQRDCTKFKKGKEYFTHEDRVCIEVGSCKQPVCDFGAYIRSSGRCPRKHEKYRTWSRFH